jgi:hypothetical protein
LITASSQNILGRHNVNAPSVQDPLHFLRVDFVSILQQILKQKVNGNSKDKTFLQNSVLDLLMGFGCVNLIDTFYNNLLFNTAMKLGCKL